MENNQSPFRFTKNIRLGIPLTSDELNEFQPFLMTKLYYYAGCEKLSYLMNSLWSLPKEFQFKLFCILFKGINPIGWIKSDKQKPKEQIEIEYLKKVYRVSTKVATEYSKLLTKDEKKEIQKKYK